MEKEPYVHKIVVHKGYEEYSTNTDEEIAQMAHTDKKACEFLLYKYKNFVRAKAYSYFLIGADRDDIVQEGMIGLYKAIRDFDIEKKAYFKPFAELCITRQIITAIKTASRQKHKPLNSYVSLNKPVYDDESERTLVDVIASAKISNPEDIIIDQEEFIHIEEEIAKMLSDFEKKVLVYYLSGYSYQIIAKALKRSEKSIDNALQRAKNKIDKFLEEEE